MTELTLELPWPPSVNNYKRIGKTITQKDGRIYQQRVNSNETRMFYYEVYMLCKKKRPSEGCIFARDQGVKLEVSVLLHPPHNRPYDIDNRLKVLLDSLQHAKVIANDVQINKLFVEKKEMNEGGKTIVTIRVI